MAFRACLAPAAIAVVFVLVALLWTFPLQHVIAYPFVFLFFGAIMGSAWFGGMIAGCRWQSSIFAPDRLLFYPAALLDVDREGVPELFHRIYPLRNRHYSRELREKTGRICRPNGPRRA